MSRLRGGPTALLIHVNRIPVGGLREQVTCDPRGMELERFDVRPSDAITASLFMTKADQELVVQAAIGGRLSMSCARCLEEFEQPLRVSAVFSYQIKPTDIVDITEDVRQEILLTYPMAPMCREQCKGLCAVCGQNLNAAACPHQQASST